LHFMFDCGVYSRKKMALDVNFLDWISDGISWSY